MDPAAQLTPAATPGPAGGSPPRVAPVVQGDWLASVCPYLASEDGTYRSASPSDGHRCMAVDPAATLPLAFQERYCLTERHPRCEMYKFAQEAGRAGGLPVPAEQLHVAATRPVRTATAGSGSNRPAMIAAAGVGAVAVLVLLLVLIMGSCSSGPGDGAGESPASLMIYRPPEALTLIGRSRSRAQTGRSTMCGPMPRVHPPL